MKKVEPESFEEGTNGKCPACLPLVVLTKVILHARKFWRRKMNCMLKHSLGIAHAEARNQESLAITSSSVFVTGLLRCHGINQGFKSPAIAVAIAGYSCSTLIKLFGLMYNLAAIAGYSLI